MVQTEAASSRTHHLLSLWAITPHKILLIYKDHIPPSRLPDSKLEISLLFLYTICLVNEACNFFVSNHYHSYNLCPFQPSAFCCLNPFLFPCLLTWPFVQDRAVIAANATFLPTAQYLISLMSYIQNPSSFLCDLGLRPSTYLYVSSSSPSLTSIVAFCCWCLLLSL